MLHLLLSLRYFIILFVSYQFLFQNAAEVLLKAKYSSLQREENPSQKSTESSSRLSPSSEETSRDTSVQETSNINELYTKFRDYLGDSLCLRLCFEGPHNSIKPNIGVVATEVSLQDLVNEKVVFNGSRFERKKERTLEDENEAKIRFLTRPPKLGGTGREGLRKRPGKAMKRQRSRSQSFKEAFPLAKNIRTYGKMNLSSLLNLPGYIEPLLPVGRSPLQEKEDPAVVPLPTMWKINQKMKTVGKRKHLAVKRLRGPTPFYLGMML